MMELFLLAGPAMLSVVCVRVLLGWWVGYFCYVVQAGLDCSVHRP